MIQEIYITICVGCEIYWLAYSLAFYLDIGNGGNISILLPTNLFCVSPVSFFEVPKPLILEVLVKIRAS